MSSTTMYPIRTDGTVDFANAIEYRNSWLGFMMIWTDIGKKHGREAGFLPGAMEAVWALAGDERVPEAERIVMAMTFDKVYIASVNFQRVIDAIGGCNGVLDPRCHAFAWASVLGGWQKNPAIRGACFQGTSVSEDQWRIFDREKETSRHVNIDTDEANELFQNTPVATGDRA
jgi:hypothetical protein